MRVNRSDEAEAPLGSGIVAERTADTPAVTCDGRGAASNVSSLDRSLVRSVAWNAVSDWSTQIISWLVFLAVMRLLAPADFGIAALAIILVPYLGQITGLGIPRAVVALPKFNDDQLAQLTAVNVIMGSLCFVLGLIIAKPFAVFFRTPPLATIMVLYCGGVLLSGFIGVPCALLAKEMRFRFLSTLGIVMALFTSFLILGMALLGFGYWSLVFGNVIPTVIRTAIILRVRPCKLAWPRINSIREPLRFGWHLSISTLASNAYQRLDNFVAARMLGQTALGLYGNAWELANVPLEKVASLVTTVIPTYLSAVQNDHAAIRRYLYGLTEIVALGSFPACIGLGLVGHEFVPVVLGPKWEGMVPALQVLSYYAAFRAIVAILPKILTAVGDARNVMWNDLLALLILPVAFYLGSYRGISGIAWGWVLAYPVVAFPLYRKTFHSVGASVGEYFRALRPALSGTIAMIPAVEWVKVSFASSQHLAVRLVLEVIAGALAYIFAVWLLHRERVRIVIQLAKNLIPAKTPVAQPSA